MDRGYRQNKMRRLLLWSGLSVTILAAACQKVDSPPTKSAPAPVAAPPAIPTAPAVPELVTSTAAFSVASFEGDTMTDCTTVSATTRRPSSEKWVGVEQLLLLIRDEVGVASSGGESMLSREGGVKDLTPWLTRSSFTAWAKRGKEKSDADKAAKKSKQPEKVLTDAEKAEKLDKGVEEFLTMISKDYVWPRKADAARVKSGDLAKVDTCEFSGRTVLGKCALSDEIPEAAWTWEQRYYSVANTIDSDAAFRNCLRIKGKWSAPDPESPEISRERMKQHGRRLQKVADPEKLRERINKLQRMTEDN